MGIQTDTTVNTQNTSRHRILVVEDETDIRDSLREVLEEEGYLVETAEDGAKALELLQSDSNGKFDLILLDLMMPNMSGSAFLIERSNAKGVEKIPVVIMSADTQVAAKANHLCADFHIKKPIELDDLLKLIKDCCI